MLIEDQRLKPAPQKTKQLSSFSNLPNAPVDEIFALNHAYTIDADPRKVNLGMGVYRTAEGQPWPLSTVQKVEEEQSRENNCARHEYLPIEGDSVFTAAARDLMFGFNLNNNTETPAEKAAKQRIASVQTVAGTGANHIGAAFLAHHYKPKHVWMSTPTWANHHTIWDLQGIERKTYPYFNAVTCAFDFGAALAVLEAEAVEGDVILLHACAHNPTGVDPSKEQWKAIAELCQRKHIFPFFDSAYQGFASGSVDEDAWAVRYFFNMEPRMEMCVAQSFSKNFGLYGHRAGAFHLVTNGLNPAEPGLVQKNLCHIIRGEYSMGPRLGSTIVKRILGDEDLRTQWHGDLTTMSSRLRSMRESLYNELLRLKTPGTWEHIVNQIGMFSYTGLTLKQVLALKDEFHIYMLKSGRVSISGLSENNVAYVAQSIDNVVRRV
ncbi:putative aspartate transaminase [Talaromyces proteolyticus]|uniref:Aspartate aminotransferase n=1 Tax=Talaromyces proteolyticus TaxID=1131652 RepID=A0AAD4KMT4_9EURO|nr:putative aspartate transaminase [Talaromyces proteolyticus]KAH8695079.1 putative aspartate transaminase [Talaromyces proteolyticus]